MELHQAPGNKISNIAPEQYSRASRQAFPHAVIMLVMENERTLSTLTKILEKSLGIMPDHVILAQDYNEAREILKSRAAQTPPLPHPTLVIGENNAGSDNAGIDWVKQVTAMQSPLKIILQMDVMRSDELKALMKPYIKDCIHPVLFSVYRIDPDMPVIKQHTLTLNEIKAALNTQKQEPTMAPGA